MNWPIIVMYHDLVPTKADATARDDLAVAWFEQELDLLEKQKWRTISMDELYEIKTNPSKKKEYPERTVLLSFDDGYEGNYILGLPRLRAKGFKSTFFVHTNFVGSTTQTQGRPRVHMGWDQLAEIEKDPLFQVFSHTANHPDLTTLSPEKLKYELEEPIRAIHEKLGMREFGQERKLLEFGPAQTFSVEYLAYPFGAYNVEVVEAPSKIVPSVTLPFAWRMASTQ